MPPPKNGSLGRGLGDLLGGVPENLGVAGVTRPNVPTESLKKEVSVVAEKRYWTPARVVMALVAGIALIMVGSGWGMKIGRKPGGPVSQRIVIITNTVVKTVMATPTPYVVPARLDVTELQALEDQGLKVVVGNDGVARVIFNEPVFSSRTVLDTERTGLLDQIGGVMAKHAGQWEVRVTGHTDTVPPRTGGPFQDNNELGLARATEVVRYLLRHTEVPASMIHAATVGQDLPPFTGDDAASRRKNRTVTLQIRAVSK